MMSMNSHLSVTQNPVKTNSARNDGRTLRKFMPGKLCLERRLMLDGSKPASLLRESAHVISIRQLPRQGSLNIQGTSGADTVEIGRSARGFVTLTVDGVVHSGDLRDRAAFDRRLLGLRVDRLTSVRLAGDDPLDTVVLNTVLGSAARPTRVQGQAVTIAAPVNQAGTLRIEANTITVSAAVSADTIMLAAAGLLNIDASGSLTASKSIALKADRLIQTGNIAAPTVSITAGVAIRSGTITAPGGSVNVDFTRNYVATEGAAIDVSAAQGDGGSIRIDGGTSGHLFNSGTLLAKGATTGGAIRVSGRDVVWIGGGADASGDVEGGLIQVGGWQGSDASMTKARTLQVSPHTSLSADGGTLGGTVVLWSEESTTNQGTIVAPGGSVEVSSKGVLNHAGTVDVGENGKLLLDPKNIVIADNAVSGVPQFELVNPTPNAGDLFGYTIVPLSTGNIVVTDPFDDSVASNAGAVYLYNGATGALISTLTGTLANDQIGFDGISTLSNGNYVIRSVAWNGNRGAVTWGSGTSGVTGNVSSSNSLVGSTANDYIGVGGITTLSNGSYVIRSGSWNGARGAATWGSGTAGVTGPVSSSNSLVGSTANDQVGVGGIMALSNGNYVVNSYNWNGARGAATWGSGTAGVTGTVSSSNSLVGSSANDQVAGGNVTALPNGNYVVISRNWSNGTTANVGAVTWGSGTAGVKGTVSATNSLIGSRTSDQVGYFGVTVLSNGNYLVRSPNWDNGTTLDVGAVTWGNGASGVKGAVSSTNSLIGSFANDRVGEDSIRELPSGNYLITDSSWNGYRGAVTWGSGTAGVTGAISSTNSLVGTTANDQVGVNGVTVLSNGNYVVRTPVWDNGTTADVGAVTWGSGTAGVKGAVSATNSLIGAKASDNVGSAGIAALTNGNYVVSSPNWDNGTTTNVGAVTWLNGAASVTGTVSTSNSLIGSKANDEVGSNGVSVLSNGNYVVSSPRWDNGTTTNVGAVTWVNGAVSVTGTVSTSNSLIGSNAFDLIGSSAVRPLTNGNYLVASSGWNSSRGAVTWGDGTAGTIGTVSASNSLVGATPNDQVGGFSQNGPGITLLSNGNYLVNSPFWDNGTTADVGAMTWGSGTEGVTGVVAEANSLIGSTAFEMVGAQFIDSQQWQILTEISNGNIVIFRPERFAPPSTFYPGFMTWISGSEGKLLNGQSGGKVTATNSFTNVGSTATVVDSVNGTYINRYSSNGGRIYVGLQTPLPGGVTFAANPASPANMSPAFVATPLSAGTATTLQANNDITVSNALAVNNPSGNGGALTVQAGRSVIFNADVTTDSGNLTVAANADSTAGVVMAQRDAGLGTITLPAGRTITAGTGAVTLQTGSPTGLNNVASGNITIDGTISAGSVSFATYYDTGITPPDIAINGSVTTSGAGGISANFAGSSFTMGAGGSLTSNAAGAPISLTGGNTKLRGTITTTGGPLAITGATSITGAFTANAGAGAISFQGSLNVGSNSAVLNTTATTSVDGSLAIYGGSITTGGGLDVIANPGLMGNGTLTGAVKVRAQLMPGTGGFGTGVGTLTFASGGLTLTSGASVNMNGTSAAAFDKVIAEGVNLGGSTLNLAFQSFTLNEGQSLTLVENTSANPTAGTFAGLPEGAFLSVNGQMLKISYTGGDGNDVAVTPVSSTLGAFNVSYGGLLYLRGTSNFRAVVTFTNASPVTLTPTAIKISGLPSRVQVVGGTQNGADWYLPWTAGSVAAGGSQGVTLNFRVLSGGAFSYSASAVIG